MNSQNVGPMPTNKMENPIPAVNKKKLEYMHDILQGKRKSKLDKIRGMLLAENDEKFSPDKSETFVDTYQVACPNGDCSIHLLVGPTSSEYRRGIIIRAILVDGGNSTDPKQRYADAGAAIYATIGYIESTYTQWDRFKRQECHFEKDFRLKFDSWVVTHWDADHWVGGVQLLSGELAQKVIGVAPKMRSAYLWYDENGNPMSYLYCPTWAMPGTQQPACMKKVDKIGQPDTVTFVVPHEWDELTNGFIFRKVTNVMNLRYKKEQLIGRDFFTDDQIEESSLNKSQGHIPLLQQTMKAFADSDAQFNRMDRPRFVCIGTNGYLMGSDVQILANSPAETLKNTSSIVSVLDWSGAPEIALYYAGDAVSSVENEIASQAERVFGGRRIRVLKLSHHGSQGSTPPELLRKLHPRIFVVSAGPLYRHPHPNLLGLLKEYVKNDKMEHEDSRRLFATRFPPWIRREVARIATENQSQNGGKQEDAIHNKEDNAPDLAEEADDIVETGTLQSVTEYSLEELYSFWEYLAWNRTLTNNEDWIDTDCIVNTENGIWEGLKQAIINGVELHIRHIGIVSGRDDIGQPKPEFFAGARALNDLYMNTAFYRPGKLKFTKTQIMAEPPAFHPQHQDDLVIWSNLEESKKYYEEHKKSLESLGCVFVDGSSVLKL